MRPLRALLAFLLAASPAAGQTVSGTVRLSPSGPAPVLAPAASFQALPAASGLVAPLALTPSLAAPSAPVPLPARVAAMSAAVAAAVPADLGKSSAGEARSSSDAAFAVLTGEPPAASAPALEAAPLPAASVPLPPSSGARTHLLSVPLVQTARLGPTARVLHYAVETAIQFLKAALVWHATGHPAAGLGVLAFELLKMPPMITAQSLADLGLRYWWRKLSVLREVSAAPAVTRVRVLTTGETRFSGILAVRQENSGLLFVDADGPLPADMSPYGTPIPVADLSERRARLVLVHDGVSELSFWTPTLGQLLAGERLPEDVASAWRARLDLDKKEKGRLARIFDFGKEKELRVEAHLSDGAGGETPLGTVAFGRGVKSLVGISRWDQVRGLFGGRPRGRAIGLSDTAVEKKGERGPGGIFSRAWRRLTGRLIVR